MRGDELARLLAEAVAETRQPLTAPVVDADPRPDIRHVAINVHPRAEIAHEHVLVVGNVDRARTVHILPLRLEVALRVEYLHAMVLPVGHVDISVGVGGDIVRDVELSGVDARLAPRKEQVAVRRILVDP